jgi:hypothetical protein
MATTNAVIFVECKVSGRIANMFWEKSNNTWSVACEPNLTWLGVNTGLWAQIYASGVTVSTADDTLLGVLYDFNFDTIQPNDAGGCQFAPSKGWDSWQCLAIDMATDAAGQKKIAELVAAK